MKRVAVLGGGGVAGIAWETGVAAGLARGGVDLTTADGFIGTSAGASLGAQLAAGLKLEALLMAQLEPAADSKETLRPYSQAAADAANRKLMDKVGGDLAEARRRIGAFALRSTTVPPEERRAIVAARLPGASWPQRWLGVVAVDTASGEHRLFDAAGGADFTDAIAASSAVPGAWPAVAIDGRLYMDGGIRSLTNADLAAGARHVVVLAPLGWGDGNPVSGHLRDEAARLRALGCRVDVVVPDRNALEALGDNVLDPARRAPSAAAGLAQGLALAPALAAWNPDFLFTTTGDKP
ncbi:MAG: patatin [Polaromonas sp.]|uniref:patatin-like phospholipase family protein n=1 Tax=Polaromonas sp. TaxID=1869339 RepID=UPI004035354E|nr:patatin [Polaromonas sp.]